MRNAPVALVLALALAACGGSKNSPQTPAPDTSASASAAPSASASAPPAPGPKAIAIVPMKLVNSTGAKNVQELKADGTILCNAKPCMKIDGATMKDQDGDVVITLMSDGKVVALDGANDIHFDESDRLVLPGDAKIWVDDDGTVRSERAGKPDASSGKSHFEGYQAAAKRTAPLIVIGLYFTTKK